MDQQLCVLLYSKYSQQSKRYMDMLKNSPIDFISVVNLKSICIDNESVRQTILNSQQIGIISVPCILIVYKDGGVEKYEGGTAFKWAEELTRSLSPPPPPIQRPIILPSSHPIQKRKLKRKPNTDKEFQQSTSIEDLESEEESEEENEEESDEEETMENFKPPAAIRSGVGNYDAQGEFGTLEEPNRKVSRGIKSSTDSATGGGKGNLMATAMAMQKVREQNEPKRPPGAPPQR